MLPIWVLIALVGLVSVAEGSQIIPPLYRYDDCNRCHQHDSSAGEYCFVRVVFEGEKDLLDSPRIIADFRRNLLSWGICIAKCQQEVANIHDENRQSLFLEKISINFTYIFPLDLWGEYLDPYKSRYSELINVCVNKRLKRDYNFGRLAYSEIEFCSSKEISRMTPNWLMITFYAIVLSFSSLLIGSNVVERLGHHKYKDHIIVSSFSVRRNWNRLTEQSSSDLYRDFSYIDGVRVILSIQVVALHFVMIAAAIPWNNPEYAEEVMKSPFMIDYIVSCAVPVQIFFAIGGLLLSTNFFKDLEQNSTLNAHYLWNKTKNRLIRIAPVYYFILLISIVVADFPGMQVGPVGYITLIQEQARCLKKWWINVLFLSNLPSFEGEVCNQYGWYLAADQQLFLATLLLLIVCWMFPKHASSILRSSIAVAVAIPAGIVYFNKLESSFPIRLSHVPWFWQVYMPGYSNLGSYIAGVIVGYLYHRHKHNKLDLENNSLYKIAQKSRIPLLALAYLPTFIFYRYEIPRSSWLTMVHTILYRNAAIFAVNVTFIKCFLNPPGIFRKVLSSKPMISLSKLSYSVYVLHIPLGRIILNWLPPTMELSLWNLIWLVPFVGTSYLVAICLYFCIEQPATLMLKHFIVNKR